MIEKRSKYDSSLEKSAEQVNKSRNELHNTKGKRLYKQGGGKSYATDVKYCEVCGEKMAAN